MRTLNETLVSLRTKVVVFSDDVFDGYEGRRRQRQSATRKKRLHDMVGRDADDSEYPPPANRTQILKQTLLDLFLQSHEELLKDCDEHPKG